MTFKSAKEHLKDFSISLTKKDGEFRINLAGPKASEKTAYYTSSLYDAVATGESMRSREQRGF